MTVVDRFLSFTRGLSAERLETVEEGLAALLESYADRYGFSSEELAEIDRRVADPSPRFVPAGEIAGSFGKSFSE